MKTTDLFHQNLSEIQVSYSHKVLPSQMERISSSRDAFETLLRIYDGNTDYCELFYIILLNRNNKVMGYHQLSKGGLSGTVADPKCAFQVALKCCASAMIIAHNHPSGNPAPSEADTQLTKKFVDAGKMLDLFVIDHLIITSESYFSFADEGLL
ncbi:MAG: RadC family protein [Bacteroidales bacterium]